MAIYFIDYENVGSAGIEDIDQLNEKDTVNIFYSRRADTMKMEQVIQLMQAKARVVFIDATMKGQKNALDFQLIAMLYFTKEKEQTCCIVSQDTGYDAAIEFGRTIGAPNVFRAKSLMDAQKKLDKNEGLIGQTASRSNGIQEIVRTAAARADAAEAEINGEDDRAGSGRAGENHSESGRFEGIRRGRGRRGGRSRSMTPAADNVFEAAVPEQANPLPVELAEPEDVPVEGSIRPAEEVSAAPAAEEETAQAAAEPAAEETFAAEPEAEETEAVKAEQAAPAAEEKKDEPAAAEKAQEPAPEAPKKKEPPVDVKFDLDNMVHTVVVHTVDPASRRQKEEAVRAEEAEKAQEPVKTEEAEQTQEPDVTQAVKTEEEVKSEEPAQTAEDVKDEESVKAAAKAEKEEEPAQDEEAVKEEEPQTQAGEDKGEEADEKKQPLLFRIKSYWESPQQLHQPVKPEQIKEPARQKQIKEPAKTEQIKEPAKTEQIKEPAKTEQIKEPVKTEQIKEPAKAGQIKEPAKTEQIEERSRREGEDAETSGQKRRTRRSSRSRQRQKNQEEKAPEVQNTEEKAEEKKAPARRRRPRKEEAAEQPVHIDRPTLDKVESIMKEGGMNLDGDRIHLIAEAIKTTNTKNRFYQFFRKKLGETAGREFYISIRGEYEKLKLLREAPADNKEEN